MTLALTYMLYHYILLRCDYQTARNTEYLVVFYTKSRMIIEENPWNRL